MKRRLVSWIRKAIASRIYFGAAAGFGLAGTLQILSAAELVAGRVILDPASVENLGIQTAQVSKKTFEETLFALGRIEVIPSHRAVVSSRISGRIAELKVFEGDTVKEGEVVLVVESRQPGNPPPRIRLRAPLTGLVVQGHASLGEPVEPTTEILEILDLSKVYAMAQIPEDQAGLLRQGMRARIRIAAIPQAVCEGSLVRFGTAADPESGTLEAVFLLSNADEAVRPQMRAEFSIVLRERKKVVAVPREALLSDAKGDYLFVKDFDLPNAFVRAEVQTGMRNDTHVEILKGLFPGDEVVIKAAYPLAYAGGGTISLKQALDAAHGHEHNEDGSEITPEQRARKTAGMADAAKGIASQRLSVFLGILLAVLLALLALSRVQAR